MSYGTYGGGSRRYDSGPGRCTRSSAPTVELTQKFLQATEEESCILPDCFQSTDPRSNTF